MARVVGNGLKWLFDRKRLPTPALDQFGTYYVMNDCDVKNRACSKSKCEGKKVF